MTVTSHPSPRPRPRERRSRPRPPRRRPPSAVCSEPYCEAAAGPDRCADCGGSLCPACAGPPIPGLDLAPVCGECAAREIRDHPPTPAEAAQAREASLRALGGHPALWAILGEPPARGRDTP